MPLYVDKYRCIASRSRMDTVTAAATKASRIVADHYGRRPLAPVHITLTAPAPLAALYRASQARAAKLPAEADTGRLWEWTPRLRHVTGLTKAGGTLTLLNARRLRRRVDLEAALVYELARVDQFLRKGGRERWITHLRDRAGVAPLTRGQRRALDRHLAQDDEEAANLAIDAGY